MTFRAFRFISVLAMLKNEAMVLDEAFEAVSTSKTTDVFVTNSEILVAAFQTKFKKVLGAQKRLQTAFFFSMLGTEEIFHLGKKNATPILKFLVFRKCGTYFSSYTQNLFWV